jgi:hypothetical protein
LKNPDRGSVTTEKLIDIANSDFTEEDEELLDWLNTRDEADPKAEKEFKMRLIRYAFTDWRDLHSSGRSVDCISFLLSGRLGRKQTFATLLNVWRARWLERAEVSSNRC